eukprot:TRINITY_DN20134_c0_g1_i1.p1 TRINITY_DN20134_c0_g1~~TRINITY_DN20134_c0_g1_i1.p1  ORF type:complete len:193 (+),score=36.85 TRINITY_DN20134_c0_g1_i1:28-579(+)
MLSSLLLSATSVQRSLAQPLATSLIRGFAAKAGAVTPTVSLTSRKDISKFSYDLLFDNKHEFKADEPKAVGGAETGPSPFEFVAAGLGACTAMTLEMYAAHKKFEIDGVDVSVTHKKLAAGACPAAPQDNPKAIFDVFVRDVKVKGPGLEGKEEALSKICDKCPVHKTLESGNSVIITELSVV